MYLDNFPQIIEYISEGEDAAARKLYDEALDKSEKSGYDDGISDMTAIDHLIEDWILDNQFNETVEQHAMEMGMQYPVVNRELEKKEDLLQKIHTVAHHTGPYHWTFCAKCN